MMKAPKNVCASVRVRLLHLARQRGDDFQLLLTSYANERLLYRLNAVSVPGQLHPQGRDAVHSMDGTPAQRQPTWGRRSKPGPDRNIFAEVIALDVGDDGLVFDVGSCAYLPRPAAFRFLVAPVDRGPIRGPTVSAMSGATAMRSSRNLPSVGSVLPCS